MTTKTKKVIAVIIITIVLTSGIFSLINFESYFSNKHIEYTFHLLFFFLLYTLLYYMFGLFSKDDVKNI